MLSTTGRVGIPDDLSGVVNASSGAVNPPQRSKVCDSAVAPDGGMLSGIA
jgi:hypothetical protein